MLENPEKCVYFDKTVVLGSSPSIYNTASVLMQISPVGAYTPIKNTSSVPSSETGINLDQIFERDNRLIEDMFGFSVVPVEQQSRMPRCTFLTEAAFEAPTTSKGCVIKYTCTGYYLEEYILHGFATHTWVNITGI